jgi:small neutral amino acid transporter SnatA (MarC family)
MNFSPDFTIIGVMFLSLIALLEPLTTLSFYAKLNPKASTKDFRRDGARIGVVICIGMITTFFLGQYILAFF